MKVFNSDLKSTVASRPLGGDHKRLHKAYCAADSLINKKTYLETEQIKKAANLTKKVLEFYRDMSKVPFLVGELLAWDTYMPFLAWMNVDFSFSSLFLFSGRYISSLNAEIFC